MCVQGCVLWLLGYTIACHIKRGPGVITSPEPTYHTPQQSGDGDGGRSEGSIPIALSATEASLRQTNICPVFVVWSELA